LNFPRERSAIVHSSWLDPRKIREMTIVGSTRMIVYDDVAQLEKIRIFDARVERPPHYDTFAEFHYSYHYGDMYAPYIKQEEPLRVECQHFIDCINNGTRPLSDGHQGLALVKILEAASASLKQKGAAVPLVPEAPVTAETAPAPAKARSQNGRSGNGAKASRSRTRSAAIATAQ
jgi:predicted dehydrogenase